jgi:hypothetical protein
MSVPEGRPFDPFSFGKIGLAIAEFTNLGLAFSVFTIETERDPILLAGEP